MLHGKIPSHLNPKELVEGVKGTKRMKDPLINGVIYILSMVSYHTIIKDGRTEYVQLNKEILDKIIGKGRGGFNRVKVILEILVSKNILVMKTHSQFNHKSRGYKFRVEHRVDEFKEYPLGDRISECIQKIHQIEENGEITNDYRYEYLEEQFRIHRISVDDSFKDHLKSVSEELLTQYSSQWSLKNYSVLILINYIGRLLLSEERISLGEFNPNVSLSNHRFNSLFTQTPKILRNYIRINDSLVSEVDIKSCQPYFLSTILFPEFTTSTIPNEFNFKTIYPKLHTLLNEIGFIALSNDGNREHQLLYCYLDNEEFETLNGFKEFDFTGDFYNHLVNLGVQRGIDTNREKVKDKMMSYLFGQDEKNRKRNLIQKILEIEYKGLNRLVERFNFMWKNNEFAVLLQRTETYILLKRVLKEFNESYPNIPIYTIHDGIYTTSEYGEFVRGEVKSKIEQITMKPIGIHFSVMSPNITSLKERIFLKTRVRTLSEFNVKSKGLMKNHIERGFQFLFPYGNIELRTFIDKYYANPPQ
jgi:hypothetical protein